jgi:hypothetical protein
LLDALGGNGNECLAKLRGGNFSIHCTKHFLQNSCSMKLGSQPTKLVVAGVIYNTLAVKLDHDRLLR